MCRARSSLLRKRFLGSSRNLPSPRLRDEPKERLRRRLCSVSMDICCSPVIWAQLSFLSKLHFTDSQLTLYWICSCKSLEYGLGYNSSGRFVNTLYKQGLGQCKLRTVDVTTNELKSCYYDYYEKKPPVSAGSRRVLSNMALFAMLVMTLIQW